MTVLSIYKDDASGKPEHIHDFAAIAARLDGVGVLIERWEAGAKLSDHAQQDEVLAAYKGSIDKLNNRYGFKSIDVVSLKPDNPKKDDFRKMFLTEHLHKDFEIACFTCISRTRSIAYSVKKAT
jgi:1,2-dihydroxy-3-keto-5-methylthiopentene dioxygenase